MDHKITDKDVNNCNNNIFGDWFSKNVVISNYPFAHTIIENFLHDQVYIDIVCEFPDCPDDAWWKYCNPLEVKYAYDDIVNMPKNMRNFFMAMSSKKIISRMEEIFSINGLQYDPYCHGGGIHMHPRNGRLNMHLDYEKHPYINKQRRLNVILYCNDAWESSWNGDTQLWDKDLTDCCVKSYPKKNHALIFETTEDSWHGVPEKITCPDGIYRKTLAYYYISNITSSKDTSKIGSDSLGYRNRATFKQTNNSEYDERIEKLCKIRPNRRITEEDMNEIWPEWTLEI